MQLVICAEYLQASRLRREVRRLKRARVEQGERRN